MEVKRKSGKYQGHERDFRFKDTSRLKVKGWESKKIKEKRR